MVYSEYQLSKPRSKWLQIAVTVGAAIALTAGIAAQSFAASTTLVTPSNPQGWAESDQRVNGASVISADQPDATGGAASLKQTSTSSSDKTNYQKLADFGPVSELSALSFDWYRDSSSTAASHFTPAFGLYVSDSTGQNSWLLKWEGVYNQYPAASGAVPTDQWVQENILNGNFWRIPQVQNGVWVGFAGCSQTGDPYGCQVYDRHLTDEWLDGYNVAGVEVGIGSGWTGTYTSFVDNVRVGDTTYNFEADQLEPVVNGENFNTHSGSDYQGVNVGFNVANFESFESVTVSLLDADRNVIVTNTGTQDLFDLYADGTTQFSTPFISTVGTYDVAGDTYWDFGAWKSTAKPVYAVITVNDVTTEITPLTEPNGVLFSDLVFTASDKEACKNNGWKLFTANYKNQGQCVAAVVSNDNSKHRR